MKAKLYGSTKNIKVNNLIDEDEFAEDIPKPVPLQPEGLSMKGLSWKFNKWID